jgi:hypothetical protein
MIVVVFQEGKRKKKKEKRKKKSKSKSKSKARRARSNEIIKENCNIATTPLTI